ncbi:MAG TPA: ester cyclase [Candidatus Limnocylindrales bacterium]
MVTEQASAPIQLETNKAVVRRFIEEVFGRHDLDAIEELASEDFTPHTWGPTPPGRDALRTATQRAGAGVSEARFDIHLLVAEDDLVAAYLTSSAVHSGDFMGLPPTGRRYSIDEMHFFRLRDGQVCEHWHEFDKGALMRQLGPSGTATSGPTSS